jgi:hypothetical protein
MRRRRLSHYDGEAVANGGHYYQHQEALIAVDAEVILFRTFLWDICSYAVDKPRLSRRERPPVKKVSLLLRLLSF